MLTLGDCTRPLHTAICQVLKRLYRPKLNVRTHPLTVLLFLRGHPKFVKKQERKPALEVKNCQTGTECV